MTKDRPRNRPGRSGGNDRSGPKKPWENRPSGRSGEGARDESSPAGSPAGRESRPVRTGPGAGPPKSAGYKSGPAKPGFQKRSGPPLGPASERAPAQAKASDRPRFPSRPGGSFAERRERPAPPRLEPDDADGDSGDEPWSSGDQAGGGDGDESRERFRPDQRGRPDHRRGPRPHNAPHTFEEANGDVWIWGHHAGGAAFTNPKRKIREALLTRNAAQRLNLDLDALPAFVRLLDPREIDDRLPPGAVHQGLAVRAEPLEGLDMDEVVMQAEKPLVILDQVTDPQNVGAVFRSAAAFGVGGVVMQTRRAPALGGALAKAAAGAVEAIPEIRAVNLARAIDALTEAGWRVIGLAGEADVTLEQAFDTHEPIAIVLGAEGDGIRPAVANACTLLARIPIGVGMESLNVSNAAAIAFYEAAKRRK